LAAREGRELRNGRDQNKVLELCLSSEHAIEWIAMGLGIGARS
jgi:hypothetical protein